MCCWRPSPRGSLSGVDSDENPAWSVWLVETSKVPSKDDRSNRSARPFDVVPTISRIGEEGWGEPESWRKARFSWALVVAACIAYLGAPAFDNNETVPVKELGAVISIVQSDEQSIDSPTGCDSACGSLLPRAIVLQHDIGCYRGIRCRKLQRRVSYECPINAGIRSLDIYVCGPHGLGATGQHSLDREFLAQGGLTPTATGMFDA